MGHAVSSRKCIPWLGKDVILLILHQAATDYETFCNVRLVAKWVAQTMDISGQVLTLQPPQVKWRHMVEDASLAHVAKSVQYLHDFALKEKVGDKERCLDMCNGIRVKCRLRFNRRPNGNIDIILEEWLRDVPFSRNNYRNYELVSKICMIGGRFHLLVKSHRLI
jgi:hypothetical protein